MSGFGLYRLGGALRAAALVAPTAAFATPSGAGARLAHTSHANPAYGWSIASDPALWEEQGVIGGAPAADFTLGSVARQSFVFFDVTEKYAGETDVCVADAGAFIARSVPGGVPFADCERLTDAAGEEIGGRRPGRRAFAAYVLHFEDGDTARTLEWRRIGTGSRALLGTVHTVDRTAYETEATRVETLLAGVAVPDPTGVTSDVGWVAGNRYADPRYGWAIAWDEAEWRFPTNVILGADLALATGQSAVTFNAFNDHGEEAAACAEDAAFSFAQIAGMTLMPDEPGRPGAIVTDDRVFTASSYTLAYAAGRTFAVAFDARSLGGYGATILIRHRADLDEYPAEAERVAALVAGLELPAG